MIPALLGAHVIGPYEGQPKPPLEVVVVTRVFVFWDIHSCERILIEDYWKFDKDSVIEIDFNVLLEGETYLPEDFYIFDKNMTWTLIKTHEDINGHCYCLKSGTI